MCRIAGFWDFNFRGNYDIEKTMISMRDTLAYGGPDDAGIYIEKEKGLALGNRRLSILDLSSFGHQPMGNDSQNLCITYNGEVYNFQEIREELINKGYQFKSNSDTEVVIKAYEQWGLEAVHKFRGMFAFALWDKKDGKLILCRDRAGVKPLYWYYKDGLFIFASELKAFHPHPKFYKRLDEKALSSFLTFGYVPHPYAIFQDSYKLEPGHFLVIDKNKGIKKIKYWDVKDYYLKGEILKKDGFWHKKSEEGISEELEQILRESFKLRMVADVPVGIFLSGGIDSSLVTALLSQEGIKLKTFTIGFYEKSYNEAVDASKIAKHFATDHREIYCSSQEALEVIPKLPFIFDEPFGDPSAIPNHLVSLLAKQKVKVSLSADGGDELFCGYPWYWAVNNRLKIMKKIPATNLLSAILKFISPNLAANFYKTFSFMLPKYSNFRDKYLKLIDILKSEELEQMYLIGCRFFSKQEIKEFALPVGYNWNINSSLDVNNMHKMMYIDFKTYLSDDILLKVDRSSMSVALESREPLLDNKIIEYTASLPIDYKYQNRTSKYLLRKILYKYIPKELLNRPKHGFSVPIYDWLKKDLKPLFMEYLNEERIKKEGLLNSKTVKILLNNYLKNRGVNVQKLWFLLMFEMWKEKWL